MPKTLRIIFLIVFPLYLIAPFQWTVAIDTRTSGRILDNFKKAEEEILFESLPFTETGANDILAHEYKMNGLDSLKGRLALIKQAYVQRKAIVSDRRMTLESAIATLDRAIETTAETIQSTKNEIYQKERKIQEYHVFGIKLKKKITEHRKIILSYLVNIYSEGNIILDQAGDIDIMKTLILSDQDTDFLLTDMTYKTLVSQLGQKFVDEYRSLVKEQYVLSIQMADEVSVLDELHSDLERQSKNMQVQKTEREKLLTVTKGQEAEYQKYIESQEQAQIVIDNAWKKAESDYQSALQNLLQKHGCGDTKKTATVIENCTRIRAYFAGEKELQKTAFASGTSNILAWPVSNGRISTFFRDASYYSSLGSQHEAIDIAVPQGSDVSAAMDGYVYYILPPTETGYSYLALKHRDGFVTVYGHLSEVKIVPYQFVKKGELIAKSGGAPGTPGAGPMTTGPHLHFEVWKNRESVDPLRFLTLADNDFSELLSKYEEKFIADIIEKTGTGAKMDQYKRKFVIRGNDETARQKFLLDRYATPDFRNWDMWVDTALDEQIDPTFLMCIGLAETTLGNHLKTAYNVGNIGNTDSGSVYVFGSPQEGTSWMAQTLNNRFLSKYTKISELSRWGNDDGSIYASSNANWHNNIIRCMSALKGRFVEDDYKFRITN